MDKDTPLSTPLKIEVIEDLCDIKEMIENNVFSSDDLFCIKTVLHSWKTKFRTESMSEEIRLLFLGHYVDSLQQNSKMQK